jgi:hypothetical protein
MTSRYHCEACQQDVEPVRGMDPLGDGLFPLWVCADCGKEVVQSVRREGPARPVDGEES